MKVKDHKDEEQKKREQFILPKILKTSFQGI